MNKFTNLINETALRLTPVKQTVEITEVKERRLRKSSQTKRNSNDKRLLNQATKLLKIPLAELENNTIQYNFSIL